MSISIFIIGLVLAGITALVALIFGIISLASGKQRNAIAWSIGFVIALVCVIVCVMQLATRLGSKIVEGVEWAKENQGKVITEGNDEFNKTERQDWLDTLRFYTSENVIQNMPADYYKNEPVKAASDGSQVLPFVFPLSIKYNSETYLGDIINDANDSVCLRNVSQMAFDENFVIARVDNTNSKDLLKEGHGEIEYILFDLRTREYLDFVNMEQLLDKSAKIGYTGPKDMRYLSDNLRGWIDYPSYE